MGRTTGTIGWRCQRCGAINGIEARYCRDCGATATSGTPVDTSQRHTQSHPRQHFGADSHPAHANAPRDINPNQRGGDSGKGILIAIIIVLLILLLGLGTFIMLRLLKDDNKSTETDSSVSSEISMDDTEDNKKYAIDNTAGSSDNNDSTSSGDSGGQSNDDEPNNTTDDSYYIVGQEYYVQSPEGLRVRSSPSTKSDDNILKRDQLQDEDISKSKPGEYAVLKPGSKVTCLEMEGNWMRISSGWICVKLGSEILVK